MSGLGDLALDIEVEDEPCLPGALLGESFPSLLPATSGSVAGKTITHEVDIDVHGHQRSQTFQLSTSTCSIRSRPVPAAGSSAHDDADSKYVSRGTANARS